MRIIVFDNIQDCGEFYNYLEFSLKHLHEVNTHNYTNMQEHPTEEKYCVFIEYKEPYVKALNDLLINEVLVDFTNDWRYELDF